VGAGLSRRGRRGRPGKSLNPYGRGNRIDPDLVKEGSAARDQLTEEGRRTISRRSLGRHPDLDDVSPEVGLLDEKAFERALSEDPDEALALLADLTGATDRRLQALARRLAGRIVVDLSRSGRARARGIGTMTRERADRAEGDIDVDASLDSLTLAMANSTPPPLDELMVAAWRRPETALCVVIDRSGSMGGERLAAAAVAAAACSWRAPQDYSVIAFGENVLVIKAQDTATPAGTVVNDVFCLRGHGVTNMAAALRAAGVQLQRSRAKRRIALLLSDCRPTTGEDPTVAARALDELCIVAPRDDGDDASALAVAAGAAWTMLAGPSDVPRALASLLDR